MINKAIICCGGYATRFLPISKAVPKEMLPILNKPIIHYIVEELFDAGITQIQILVGRGRETLLNYLDLHPELDIILSQKKDAPQINFFPGVTITYRRVPSPKGAADNIFHAREFVGNEPFIVAYCDDVFFECNPTIELISDFEKNRKPIIAACQVKKGMEHLYGIIQPIADGKNFNIREIVEKPVENPPSNLCACGRYLVTSDIFKLIEDDMKIIGGSTEVCMTKQLNKLAKQGFLRAIKIKGKRFDTGIPKGLVEANNFFLSKNM